MNQSGGFGLVVLIFVSVVLPISLDGRSTNQLEGCPDPATLAAGLEKLRASNWSDISVAQLQRVWPTRLRPVQCDDGNNCSAMAHEGRTIDGEFECAEVFDFATGRNENGTERQRLEGIVIHYTARNREQSISAAKVFSGALGLPAADILTVGRADQQHFQWKDKTLSGQLLVLDLRWTRLGPNWNLYLASARYLNEPVSSGSAR